MKSRFHIWGSILKIVSCSTLAVCLTVFCLVSPVIGLETKKINLFALIVGLEKYKDPSIPSTPMASAATQVHDFLVERRDLFANVKVALLVNETATKANIVEVLTKQLSEAGKDDVVLIFMNAHGGVYPVEPGKFYFITYDEDKNNPGTRLQLNDKRLFQNIKSEKLLFATGSCYSGGFLGGMRGVKGAPEPDFLGQLLGRFGISAARDDEPSWNALKYGMDVFGFYFIRGLRGEASTPDGKITVKTLYDYLSREISKETGGIQHPQLFIAKGNAETTTIYSVPTYAKELKIDVKFFYETGDDKVMSLTDDTILKSGQHIGIAFKPDADCYVHILWWDSFGQVGRLFPNPKLTEGTGEAKAGQTYWLPSKEGGKHWYVLDDKPGYETVYFVASRERNPKLEKLYEELQAISAQAKATGRGDKVALEIEREINLMGFADYTVPVKSQKVSYESKERLFSELESKIKVNGAEAFFKWRFKHEAR